jgi:hypothetical protein
MPHRCGNPFELKNMGIARGEIEYLVLNGSDERIDPHRH